MGMKFKAMFYKKLIWFDLWSKTGVIKITYMANTYKEKKQQKFLL